MYPLTEKTPYASSLQWRFAKEVAASGADYLVDVHIRTSWFNWYVNKKLAEPLLGWIEAYQNKYYDVVGVIDMVSRDETVYRWDGDAASYKPRADNYIRVLKRKPA